MNSTKEAQGMGSFLGVIILFQTLGTVLILIHVNFYNTPQCALESLAVIDSTHATTLKQDYAAVISIDDNNLKRAQQPNQSAHYSEEQKARFLQNTNSMTSCCSIIIVATTCAFCQAYIRYTKSKIVKAELRNRRILNEIREISARSSGLVSLVTPGQSIQLCRARGLKAVVYVMSRDG